MSNKHPNLMLFEAYDENWQQHFYDANSNGYVVIHKEHGKHEREGNLKIALRLAQMGYRVELLPVSVDRLSPDATVDGEIWEFKSTLGSYSSIQSRLREGKEQSSKIILALPSEFILGDILRGILSAINVDKDRKIEVVALLFDYEIIFWSRLEIKQKQYSKFKHYFE
jgi:hypothetical protein